MRTAWYIRLAVAGAAVAAATTVAAAPAEASIQKACFARWRAPVHRGDGEIIAHVDANHFLRVTSNTDDYYYGFVDGGPVFGHSPKGYYYHPCADINPV